MTGRLAPVRWRAALVGLVQVAALAQEVPGETASVPVAEVLPLLREMEAAWARVEDYTAVLEKRERMVDGRSTVETVLLKFRKPDQHYFEVLTGANAGSELIYPIDERGEFALAHPGGLGGAVARVLTRVPGLGSLVPRKFDIRDPRLLRDQHHPVTDSSLQGMLRLVARNLRLAARNREGRVRLDRRQAFDTDPLREIEVILPADAGKTHTVRPGETLWTIAQDHDQDMYVILYNNPQVRDPKGIEPEQQLFVPRYYAPRNLLRVSRATGLLLELEIYDDAGYLYEAYAHTQLQVNVGLGDEDFDPRSYRF